MKHEGVSEIVGGIILISIAVLAMGIIVVILLSGPLPTSVPAFTGLVTNSSQKVYITHEGGDPLYPGQYQVLVDGRDETYNFSKSITGPFSLGKVMNATLPSMPGRIVLVFNSSWGGKTILLSADLGGAVTMPTGVNGTYFLSSTYQLVPTSPSGSSTNSISNISFYSTTFTGGEVLNAGTLHFYFTIDCTQCTMQYNLSYGSGSSWTPLGTSTPYSANGGTPVYVATQSINIPAHTFAAGEQLRLSIGFVNVFPGDTNGVWWDGSYMTTRITTP